MATYSVQYIDGYGHAGGTDHETLDVEGFRLDGEGTWMDFYDADDTVILRVRAEHVLRIELVATKTPDTTGPQEEFDPEDEELAG